MLSSMLGEQGQRVVAMPYHAVMLRCPGGGPDSGPGKNASAGGEYCRKVSLGCPMSLGCPIDTGGVRD